MARDSRQQIRERIHKRIRSRVSGTPERPRLAVFRSVNHIYAQVIDDQQGHTLVAAASTEKDLKGKGGNVEGAKQIGKAVAERAKEKGISKVVFDRGGLRQEVAAVPQPAGGGPDDVGEPGRRVFFAQDVQILVADHVEQDQRLDARQCVGGPCGLHVMPAPVRGVGVQVPFAEGLFAVEEQQLDGEGTRALLQHPAQFEECGGA